MRSILTRGHNKRLTQVKATTACGGVNSCQPRSDRRGRMIDLVELAHALAEIATKGRETESAMALLELVDVLLTEARFAAKRAAKRPLSLVQIDPRRTQRGEAGPG